MLTVLLVIAAIIGLVILAPKLPGKWPIVVYALIIAFLLWFVAIQIGLISGPIVLRS